MNTCMSLILCNLLLAIGIVLASVGNRDLSSLQANATLVKNVTASERVRSGMLNYTVSCAVSSLVQPDKITFVAWEVALEDNNPSSSTIAKNGGTCHVYLRTRDGDGDKNCAIMSDQQGTQLASADKPWLGLRIQQVSSGLQGTYSCRVYADNQLYTGFTRLLVEDKPSAPFGLQLSAAGPASLRAVWQPPVGLGNLALLRYELSGPGLRINVSAAATNFNITNLQAYTGYCLLVTAVNEAGRSPASAEVCAKTGEGKPDIDALKVEVIRANDTAAVLRLSLNKNRLAGLFRLAELNFQLLRHLEQPRHSPLFNIPQRQLSIRAKEFDGVKTINRTFDGLEPFSSYKLTYRVFNGVSESSSSELTFETAEGLAPPPNLLVDQMSIYDSNVTARCQLHGRANGRLASYRVFVSLQGSGSLLFERSYSASLASLVLTGLRPYTSYTLRAAVVTGAGIGPKSATNPVLTDPGAPTTPSNFSAVLDGRQGLLLSWDNQPVIIPDGSDRPYPMFLLSYRLHWEVLSNASTAKAYWDSPRNADRLHACDCREPSETHCQPANSRICLLVSWSVIVSRSRSTAVALSLAAGSGPQLRLWIQAFGKSNYDTESRKYFGNLSEPSDLALPAHLLRAGGLFDDGGIGGGDARSRSSPGGSLRPGANGKAGKSSDGIGISRVMTEVGIALTTLISGAIVVLLLSLGWRWLCARRRGYQRPFSQGLETFECLTADNEQAHSSHSACSARPQLKRYSQTEHPAMSVTEFRDHIIASHANDNSAFQLEFEDIQRVTHKDWPVLHAKHPDNLNKNRYTDICPYDHSRVVLLTNSGKKMGDYINANYVDGYRRDKAYIACQGPVPSTFDDFWLMVWENRCTAIVMISNFVERGRRKCDQYWPSSGSEVYGAISVKLVRQLNKAAYCMREFAIRNLRAKKLAKERQLFHFHYSEWPDYGVPAYPLPVLNFVQRTAAFCGGEQSGPVVVHCSAGVGRTGTFICIESQIRQILCEKTVNVRGFLEHIRQQRMRLVQTEEQYIFIHDVLLEFLLCPEREISMERLPDYFSNLMEETEPCGCTGLETQYQLCVAHQPSDYELASALKPCNFAKNRADVYPIESRRVKLTSEPGVEGSDYINASHVHGYQPVNEFVITQLPMRETLFDFYKMIWDQNCVCVVCVHPSLYSEEVGDGGDATATGSAAEQQQQQQDNENRNLPEIWPTNESEALTAGYLQVWFRSREDYSFGECREFLLASNKDDYSVLTSVWTLKRWPETFGESICLIELVKAVSNTRGMFTLSPIIVMDMYGGSYAGIICSLYVLYKQLMMEGTADVYSLFKMYHLQRPGMFNSKADLEFIYAVISFHAKYFSPSNSLSLRRNNPNHHHHGNGSLTTQQSHDSHEPMPRASSPPESLPLRQITQQQQQLLLQPATATTIASSIVDTAEEDSELDKAPVIRFANGRRRLSASRSAHGSFCVGANLQAMTTSTMPSVPGAAQCYSTHTG